MNTNIYQYVYPHLAKDVDVNDMHVHKYLTHIILIYWMPRMTQYTFGSIHIIYLLIIHCSWLYGMIDALDFVLHNSYTLYYVLYANGYFI